LSFSAIPARNTISGSQERTVICDIVAKQTLTSETKKPSGGSISYLFRIHAPMVLNAAFRVLRDRSLAEDVLQETFLKFCQMKDRVDEALSIPGLLRKISINMSIDILRKRGRERSLQVNEEEGQGSLPSVPITHVDLNEALIVRELLESLPSVDRLILELRYGEQLSYDEISQALDMTIAAVAQRIRRGKNTLRREFESGKRGPHELP
jgi:RNA polymerase sigma-70 factor (ECF subfamily)